MQLVPLRSLGKLERLACCNWCEQNIGPEGPLTWFQVQPTHDWHGKDVIKYKQFVDSGFLYAIAFKKEEDAVVFKLFYGL
jgi:hypothetical protein